MTTQRFACAALSLLIAALAASCRETPPSASAPADSGAQPQNNSADQPKTEPIRVFVSVPPQAWLVERIGGPRVRVDVLIGPGQDPHTFVATPRQIADLNQAQLYFAVGLPLERQLRDELPQSVRVIDTAEGMATLPAPEHHDDADQAVEAADAASADHDEAEHDHGAMDPHVWLSLRNDMVMAARIRDALTALDPDRKDGYAARCEAVAAQLIALDDRLTAALAPLKGRRFYVYHPAFGYFARDYGLVQEAVEIAGKQPSARQLAALIDRAKADGVRVVFVQKQFAATSVNALAEALDAVVVPMDPLARDLAANFADMAAKLERALATK